jgi:hypothetical protein
MDKLKFINEQMNDVLEIPYEFGEWTSDIQYPYYVGEITEDMPMTEDGAESSTLILNGFHRGAYIDLERDKQAIKQHFHPVCGLRGMTEHGAIAVFYGGAFNVPTNEADLKRIQINLVIKEWKGAI